MPATPTRPRLEQIRFTSSKTGTHNIDTYLESAEIGNRTLASLLADLFDENSNGDFRSDIFDFRSNDGLLQFRVGTYLDPEAGWQDVDFRTITGKPAVTFPMSTEYPSQSMFLLGSKLYISNTAIQYSTQAAFDAGVTAGDVIEIFDANNLSTAALDQAVLDAQAARDDAEDATINNADFNALVARLTDIQNLANPAANLTALEAFGDSYTANNSSNAITGLNNIGNTATAVTGLTNLKDSATALANLANSAAAIDLLGDTQNIVDAIELLGDNQTRVDAIDALGDTTTAAAIDRLNQTDSSSTNNPQDTTADYIDALGTSAMVAKLVALHAIITEINALASRTTAIDALNQRTTEIDALYAIRADIDAIGDTTTLNDISTVAGISTTHVSSIDQDLGTTDSPTFDAITVDTIDPDPNNIGTPLTIAGTITTGEDAVINGVNIGTGPGTSTYYGGENTRVGKGALGSISSGLYNSAFGFEALQNETGGSGNTAVGIMALRSTSGSSLNTAVGRSALKGSTSSPTTGDQNVAVGAYTMVGATSAGDNVAVGAYSSQQTTTGRENVSVGAYSLQDLTNGVNNVAVGYNALNEETSGDNNVAIGHSALRYTSNASANIAIGKNAMVGSVSAPVTDNYNTAVGYSALSAATSARGNSVFGYNAGDSITTGDYNIVVGLQADASTATTSHEITLGNNLDKSFRIPGSSFYINGGSEGTTGTRVGVNIASPQAQLHVDGDTQLDGNITVSGTVNGRDIAADGSKLNGIEAGATADQTGAEIKALYEAEANAFTDAQFTKLAGIETGATADQTGSEIKTALFAEADTNNLTDTLLTKLNGIEANADVTDTANVTAAGALMDSEVTNLQQVKEFDSANYATAAQGTLADTAVQPSDDRFNIRILAAEETVPSGYIDTGGVLTDSASVTYRVISRNLPSSIINSGTEGGLISFHAVGDV